MKRTAHHPGTHGEHRPWHRALQGPSAWWAWASATGCTGLQTGDIPCWEKVWCTYSSAMGAAAAKTAVGQLSCWVRAINRTPIAS